MEEYLIDFHGNRIPTAEELIEEVEKEYKKILDDLKNLLGDMK